MFYGGDTMTMRKDKSKEKLKVSLGKLVEAAKEVAKAERGTTPTITINIKNSNVILGDVQPKNVQTGYHASTHKQLLTAEKKKGILRRVFKIVGAIIVGIIASLLADILCDFGWIKWIRVFVHNILMPK